MVTLYKIGHREIELQVEETRSSTIRLRADILGTRGYTCGNVSTKPFKMADREQCRSSQLADGNNAVVAHL